MKIEKTNIYFKINSAILLIIEFKIIDYFSAEWIVSFADGEWLSGEYVDNVKSRNDASNSQDIRLWHLCIDLLAPSSDNIISWNLVNLIVHFTICVLDVLVGGLVLSDGLEVPLAGEVAPEFVQLIAFNSGRVTVHFNLDRWAKWKGTNTDEKHIRCHKCKISLNHINQPSVDNINSSWNINCCSFTKMLPANLIRIFNKTLACLSEYRVIVGFYLVILLDNVWVNEGQCWWVKGDLTSHKDDVVHFVNLTVGSYVWRSPMTYTLHMHILLNILELCQSVLVKFAFVVPNSGWENDFTTWYLHAHSYWWF